MIGSNDGYRDHCVECIHFAPWPERMERSRDLTRLIPRFPLCACMASPTKAMTVAPDYSPDDAGCIAYGCESFERGDRDRYIKEVCRD